MKKKVELIIGIFALLSFGYKLFQCPTCEDSILWFTVPGYVYLLFWGILSAVILYGVYTANTKTDHKIPDA